MVGYVDLGDRGREVAPRASWFLIYINCRVYDSYCRWAMGLRVYNGGGRMALYLP